MSENTQIIDKPEKSSGRNWTEQERDLVWEQVCQAKVNSIPLTECFRQITKLLPHRSEAAIGMLYYNVLRHERNTEEQSASETKKRLESRASMKLKRDFRLDTDLIEAFQGLPEYITQLHKRIDGLETQITNPSSECVIQSLIELVNGYQQNDGTKQNLANLTAKIKELEQQNKELQSKLEQVQQSYDDALGIYDMFTNMASISQIMSLGDFKQQMKTTLDKWGNVLELSFERTD